MQMYGISLLNASVCGYSRTFLALLGIDHVLAAEVGGRARGSGGSIGQELVGDGYDPSEDFSLESFHK